MATNFMMKVIANGTDIEGEARQSQYAGWVEVLAYEFSGDRAGAGESGSRRMGAPNFGNFVIRKRADRASPQLMRAFALQEVCTMELALLKSGGEMQKYITLELEEAVITKFVQGNLGFGGEAPDEELHFSYQLIRIT